MSGTEAQTRHAALVASATAFRTRAAEHYLAVRRLAEELRDGFCGYLQSDAPPCVQLVVPAGPFEGRDYGDQAFSAPPEGFQPLGPIAFGLAVRVTGANDWMRLVVSCAKEGERFIVSVKDGPTLDVVMPLTDADKAAFFDLLFGHMCGWFDEHVALYDDGAYGGREIGFDFGGPARV